MSSRVLAFFVAVVVAPALTACAAASAPTVSRPALGREAATQVVEGAQQVERATFADLRAERLHAAFAGPALRVLEAQVAVMAARGIRVEEAAVVVALVAWDPGAAEAVLQVESQRRLITLDEPDPAWSSSVRQWWSKLRYQSGSWWVVDEQDLGPDRWRPAS